MAVPGLQMMLKAMGIEIDPAKLIADVEQMGKFLADLHLSQARCEKLIVEMHTILKEAAPQDQKDPNDDEQHPLPKLPRGDVSWPADASAPSGPTSYTGRANTDSASPLLAKPNGSGN